jgi:predicted dienelactone hydrolase
LGQLWREGYVWQLTPAYFALALPAMRWWLCGISLCFVMAPWAMLPFPMLDRPNGPYGVGTQIFRWKDAARPERLTRDPKNVREVIVQAWYPTEAIDRGKRAPYMDALDRLPDSVSILPGFLLRRFDLADTHADLGAGLLESSGKLPVVLFSPGYGASRSFYTGLVAGLASEGFVVLAVDHPYEAALVELSDGRVATTIEEFSSANPDRKAFMEERQKLRVEDLRFVVSNLDRLPFASHLDENRVAAIGHSFGGASAVRALEVDTRFHAAVNVDGTIYGEISDAPLGRPFLLIESDPSETGHSKIYMDGNGRFLERAGKLGRRERLLHANHYSFTDVPLYFSPPGRFGLSLLMGGSRGAVRTQRETVSLIAGFLRAGQQPKP